MGPEHALDLEAGGIGTLGPDARHAHMKLDAALKTMPRVGKSLLKFAD